MEVSLSADLIGFAFPSSIFHNTLRKTFHFMNHQEFEKSWSPFSPTSRVGKSETALFRGTLILFQKTMREEECLRGDSSNTRISFCNDEINRLIDLPLFQTQNPNHRTSPPHSLSFSLLFYFIFDCFDLGHSFSRLSTGSQLPDLKPSAHAFCNSSRLLLTAMLLAWDVGFPPWPCYIFTLLENTHKIALAQTAGRRGRNRNWGVRTLLKVRLCHFLAVWPNKVQ